MPITGSCHCGAVSFEYRDQPDHTTSCNCSICRRLGALWIYTKIANVTIKAKPDATIRYIRDSAGLAFHSCKICGCTTHWENLKPDEYDHMAVNLRLADPNVIAAVPVRNFDGAETWEFLD